MGTGQRPSTIDEKKAVERFKRKVEDARARLEVTRRRLATLERDVSIFKGAMSPVACLYDRDLPDAIQRLKNMTLALEAYLATPTVSLAEQVERARAKVASMRRGGEVLTAEEQAAAERERAELEDDEKRLAAARDAALAAIKPPIREGGKP